MKSALRKAFDFFDADGSGDIDKSELGKVMRAVGDDPTETEIAEVFAEVDRDDSGRIEFREFYKFMRRRMEHVEKEGTGLSKASEAEIMQLFHAFDRDGDGTITVQEFAHTIKKSLRVNLSNKELSALVDEVDRDKDNTVGYSECISMAPGRRLVVEVLYAEMT